MNISLYINVAAIGRNSINSHRVIPTIITNARTVTSLVLGSNCARLPISQMVERNCISCTNVPFRPVIRGMAGSNKWHNIKGTKMAKDMSRSATFNEIFRRMKVAVGGDRSFDPDKNPELAKVLERADAIDVPKATIKRHLERLAATNTGENARMFGLKGPGRCLLIVDTLSSNEKRAETELRGVVKKYRSKLVELKEVMHAFDHRAKITVPVSATTSGLDSMVDIAIECEAEEVVLGKDDNDSDTYEFLCDGADMMRVKGALEAHSLPIGGYEDGYFAKVLVDASDDEKDLSTLIDKLRDKDFVVNIYDNVAVE